MMENVKAINNKDLNQSMFRLSKELFRSKVNSIDTFARRVLRSKKRKNRDLVKILGENYFKDTLIKTGNKLNTLLEVEGAKLTSS